MIGNLLKTLYSVSYFLQHYRGDINVIFILVIDNQERLLALVHRHIEVVMGYKNISNLDPNFLITTLFYSGVTMVEIRCIFHQPPFYMLCHLRSIKSTLLWIHEKTGDVSDPSLAQHLDAPSQWLMLLHAVSHFTRTHGGYSNFCLPILVVQGTCMSLGLGKNMKQVTFLFYVPYSFTLPPPSLELVNCIRLY